MKKSRLISILGLSMVLLSNLGGAHKTSLLPVKTPSNSKDQGQTPDKEKQLVNFLGLGMGYEVKELPIEVEKPELKLLANQKSR